MSKGSTICGLSKYWILSLGSLRENLDPFDQNDDAVLNDALDAAGLFSLQEDAGEASLSLDTKISSGGGNLSVGQRQIIALARAMIRGSKLLMLDEGECAVVFPPLAWSDRIFASYLCHWLVIPLFRALDTRTDAVLPFRLQDRRRYTANPTYSTFKGRHGHHCGPSLTDDHGFR